MTPFAERAVAAVIVTAALSLLTAACGGGTPATRRSASDAVAFSHCMRSYGVLSFPDPSSGGAIPKESLQQLGVSSSRFQAAVSACRRLLPNGGRAPDEAAQQRVVAQAVQFSRCVRSHGVPNFPDPGSDGRIPDPAGVGIDQASPRFQAANQACGRYRPPYMPSNAAYSTWVRSHPGG
jgi:hypothetical protein